MSQTFHHTHYLIAGLIAALMAFATPTAWAQLTVFPDRFAITEGETIQLTVEVDQRTASRPDFSPLTRDFHFLGSKQMTVSSYANGANHNTTRWKILLRPRRTGDLQIPPLQLNNEYSQPQLITVEGIAGAAALISSDAFLESSTDSYEVYQNSQLLYSIRLFHLDELPPMSTLSELVIPGTKVLPLGDKQQYTRQMKGQAYLVTEQSYAIFPEQNGPFTIPPAHFSAGPGTPELNTDPINVDVLPRVSQTIRGYWLPAAKLTLEDLTTEDNSLVLGESQLRILKISAEGLMADQLPALMPLRNELAQITVEDVSLEQNVTVKGISSSRTETVRITPAERGEVTLPEIIIPWWDINSDKSERVRLDKVVLKIEPAAVEEASVSATKMAEAPVTEVSASPPEEDLNNNSMRVLVWLLTAIAIISSLGWLYSHSSQRRKKFDIGELDDKPGTLFSGHRQKNVAANPASEHLRRNSASQQNIPQDRAQEDSAKSESGQNQLKRMLENEQQAFKKALDACYNDLPLESRLLILDWARLFWPGNTLSDSLDLSEVSNSKTLELLLMDMESYISGSESGQWSGDLLAKALEHIRDSQLRNTR
ncbi:BatD family protein [uncultured Amphritea sp.]|uniref:BatD family protein n=1 Tax=uncultured Amphritea sp. TaxID=981605 RepID=UPI0026240FAC|nr:BatD family protein [uncultured Amphritea sp.]